MRFTKRRTICELGMRPEATASSSAWKLLPLPLAMTTMRHGEAMVMSALVPRNTGQVREDT